MPMPDNKRERGAKTQQSQQTVQVSDMAQPEVSAISGGGASIRPQLQINPNQAQIVKTGGELASMFAGIADGVQKGIKAYEFMESTVEEARYTNWETDFLRQNEAVNGDPTKMREWMDANPFTAGRHTKKKYWTLHAEVAGKAYADDQQDFYNDTMTVAANKVGEDRMNYLRSRLGELDENSPVYDKLLEQTNAQAARVAAYDHQNRMSMFATSTQNTLGTAMRTALDNGADYNTVVNSDFGITMQRAINFGIASVDDQGRFVIENGDEDPQIITANEFGPDLDAMLMARIGEASEGMDADRAKVLFNAIDFDKDSLAVYRQRDGSTDSRSELRSQRVKSAFNPPQGAEDPLSDLVAATVAGTENDNPGKQTDAIAGNIRQTLSDIANSDKSPKEKLDAMKRVESILDDGYTAISDNLSETLRRDLRTEIGRARRSATADAAAAVDALGVAGSTPGTNGAQSFQANSWLATEGVGMMMELGGETGVVVNLDGQRNVVIPSARYKGWAALNKSRIDSGEFRPVGVAMDKSMFAPNRKAVINPNAYAVDLTGASDIPDDAEPYLPFNIPLQEAEAKNLKYLSDVRKIENPDIPFNVQAHGDSYLQLAATDPIRASHLMLTQDRGGQMFSLIAKDKNALGAVRPIMMGMLDHTQYDNFESWQSSTGDIRRLLQQNGQSAETFFGFTKTPGQQKAEGFHAVSLDPVNQAASLSYMAAIHGDVIFDDYDKDEWPPPQQEVRQRLEDAAAIVANDMLIGQDTSIGNQIDAIFMVHENEDDLNRTLGVSGTAASESRAIFDTGRSLILENFNRQNGTDIQGFDELLEKHGALVTATYRPLLQERSSVLRMGLDMKGHPHLTTPEQLNVMYHRGMDRFIKTGGGFTTNPNDYTYEDGQTPMEQALGSFDWENGSDPNVSAFTTMIARQSGLTADYTEAIRRGLQDGGLEGAVDLIGRIETDKYGEGSVLVEQRMTKLRETLEGAFVFDRDYLYDNNRPQAQSDGSGMSTGGLYKTRAFQYKINPAFLGSTADKNARVWAEGWNKDPSHRIEGQYGLNVFYVPNMTDTYRTIPHGNPYATGPTYPAPIE